MPDVSLTVSLRSEYEDLFNNCVIRPERLASVEALIAGLLSNRVRYENVGGNLGIPWFFVAVIHNMEASQNFTRHLHNGDR
jgi:lysozyme family protein